MQHPMRAVIRLDNPAEATLINQHSASLFIPGSWTGKRVAIKPAPGVTWSHVQAEEGDPTRVNGQWELSGAVAPGRWQRVTVAGGPIAGAVVEASDPLHIALLEAWYDPPEALSIRVRLGKSPATTGRQGLITLLFTLTDERGEQVGTQEVSVGARTAELAVALPIIREPAGLCRLKAALCINQAVIDDARIDVTDFE